MQEFGIGGLSAALESNSIDLSTREFLINSNSDHIH